MHCCVLQLFVIAFKCGVVVKDLVNGFERFTYVHLSKWIVPVITLSHLE